MAQLHGPRRNSAMEPVFEPAVAEMSRPVHARTALSLFIGLGSAKVGQASQIANIKRGWANWHTLPEWAAARVPTPLFHLAVGLKNGISENPFRCSLPRPFP
jgi:hypothetical protein